MRNQNTLSKRDRSLKRLALLDAQSSVCCGSNALNRQVAREAASDRCYQQAAKSLRRIAETLDRNLSDDQLAKFAEVNRASHGLLSDLIAAQPRVAFALPRYRTAAEFFAPLERTVDDILSRARRAMN
jgi:hypothetical protein